jgi:chromosome segregation protein
LDEVDAALDDANVERFIEAVNHFTSDTQFVVVTHNRITMSRCERLFGVTMRKRGVSMVVSVELSEIPEGSGGRFDLEGKPAERGAPMMDPAVSKPRARALSEPREVVMDEESATTSQEQ